MIRTVQIGVGEREVDLPEIVQKYWAEITVAAGATSALFWKLVDWRSKAAKDKIEISAAERVAKLDLAKFAQEAAAFAVQTLTDQLKRQASQIEDQDVTIRALQEKVNEVLQEYADMVGLKDAELAASRGRIHQLEAEVEALKRTLMANDIPIPLTFKAMEVVGYELKTMGAANGEDTGSK